MKSYHIFRIKKHGEGLCTKQGPSNIKHRYQRHDELHGANNGHFSKLSRKIKKTAKFRSDPTGNVINLSNYEFSKATYKLLNRNLNFVPTQSKYNENKFDKSIENFYRKIKLTAYCGKNDQDKNLT